MTRPISFRSQAPRPLPFGFLAVNSPRWWVAALCLYCGLAIVMLSWVSRFSMRPDGISYLDMADQLLKGDLRALVHPYWSPLYPCLLALALRVFSPTPSGEVLVVHLVNCLIGLGALASFTFFVSQWSRLRGIDRKGEDPGTSFWLHTGFAYFLFLWGTGGMIGFADATPDLCVAALVYLAAGLCCRLTSPRGGWGTSVWLGVALALGYFSKAAMLPLGLALLVLLAIPRLFVPRRRLTLAIAGVFVITIGPHVFLLSRLQDRLTFGEAGRLNYAWLVLQEIPSHAGWSGDIPGAGKPVHPPRVLRVGPTVLVFKDTVPGTSPLWYDPTYFHEGLQTRFDARKQLLVLWRSSKEFCLAQGRNLLPLLAGAIVFCAFAIRRRFRLDSSRLWLILWSLAAFCMYALVTVEGRYIAPFLVLFWIAVYDMFSPGMLASVPKAHRAVIGTTVAGIALSQLLFLGSAAIHSIREPQVHNQDAVARELARLGLRPGDEIAAVGHPFYVYYARLARLRVIASIGFRGDGENYKPDTDQFWGQGDSDREALNEQLRRVGAKAIVSGEKCNTAVSQGWRSIKNTNYCVQLLE